MEEPSYTGETSPEFNWEKAERTGFLSDLAAKMPRSLKRDAQTPVNSRRVLIPVLFAISQPMNKPDEWSFPGHDTLALAAGCSRRMVTHAIIIWERLGILVIERRRIGKGKKTKNYYQIRWNVLFELTEFSKSDVVDWLEDRCHDWEKLHPDQCESFRDQCATTEHQSESFRDQCASSLRPNPFLESKGIQELESIKDGTNGFLEIADFANPERVQELWELNCKLHPELYQLQNEETRRRFFAFCHHTFRTAGRKDSEGKPVDTIAVFVAGVKRGPQRFWFDDEHDMAWAKRVIAELDGVVLVGSASHEAASVDLDWEIEDQREQQLQRDRGVALEAAYALGLANQENEQIIRERPSDFLRSLYQRRKQKAK